jgi:hypothetical protein
MTVSSDIASLRTRYQSIASVVFGDRCSISRVAQTDDGRGGWTETWSTRTTGIPCTFVPYATGQKEIVIAGKPKGMADGDVWLPALFNNAALDVKEADRIVIAASGSEPARTLEIVFPAPHQGIQIKAVARYIPSA